VAPQDERVSRFEELVAEGEAAPVEGWDFSWLNGRASEERPPWGYASLVAGRIPGADRVLDVQTGGGEVFAGALGAAHGRRPATVRATESWPPNVAMARDRLRPYGGEVAEVADDADLPYGEGVFDLVVSRHPTVVVWHEVARVLRRGGTYLSQQVGPGSVRELTDFMMGPQPVSDARSPARARAQADDAGLEIVDLREKRLRIEFHDVGAVVHFLRKVVWIVPGFTVAGYARRLAALHERIVEGGPFVAHSQRYLVEARRR
jgi:SAM-dependent methyltransferase